MWTNLSTYTRHRIGIFHNGYNTWLRRMKVLKAGQDKFKCPYGCGRQYENIGALTAHVEKWKPTNKADRLIAKEHERRKADDGWYTDTWRFDGAAESLRQRTIEYGKTRHAKKNPEEPQDDSQVSLKRTLDAYEDEDEDDSEIPRSTTSMKASKEASNVVQPSTTMQEMSQNARKRGPKTKTKKELPNGSIADWLKATDCRLR